MIVLNLGGWKPNIVEKWTNNFSISEVIKNTGKSWTLAKAAHDKAVLKAHLKEKEILNDRQSKEKIIDAKFIKSLESEGNTDTSKKSFKKARLRAEKESTTDSNHIADHGNTIKTTNNKTCNETHQDSSGGATLMTDETIQAALSDSSSNHLMEDPLSSLSHPTHIDSRPSSGRPKVDDTIFQAKKFMAANLSIDDARKVLLDRALRDVPRHITKRSRMKETSPYCSNHLPGHRQLTKKINKSNRFQSAAIQAKLYADIVSRSMHIRRDRLDHLVKISSLVVNNDGHAAPVMNMKNPETGNTVRSDSRTFDAIIMEEPYQRFDAGKVPFFDRSSSVDKGRFRVRDARNFAPDSIRRMAVPWDIRGTHGVMLLVGKKYTSTCDRSEVPVDEQVITVLFDRPQFNEDDACRWWQLHRHHIV